MAESRILIGREENRALIKIEGEGTFQNAGALKRACLDLLNQGVTEFIFDLSTCDLLDSTMIGIILGLALKIKESGATPMRVRKANAFIQGLFRNLGLDRLVVFENSNPTEGDRRS